MKFRLSALIFGVVLTCIACHRSDPVVVRVYDKELSLSRLQAMLPAYNTDDSITLSQQHIQAWIQEQVLLHEAERSLSSQEQDFKEELNAYRTALMIHAYENKYLASHVTKDLISNEEIEAYYRTHPQQFLLQQNAIKLHFIKFNANAGNIEKVKKLFFKTRTAQEEQTLENICVNDAENFYLQNQWILFDDVLKELPLKDYTKERFQNKETDLTLNDSDYLYLVKIIDYKTSENIAPLSIVQNQIIDLLLQEKQIIALEQLHKKALDKAKNNGEIIY
ncbi:MAG: hypothetical protein J6Y47_08765 [Bacteroidales bacterium]|nr:hypothetical protein [Bacteroidales bacterium]